MRTLPLLPLLLSGCWKTDPAELPVSGIGFTPEAGAPDGWIVERFDTPLECPDGQPAELFLVRHELEPGPVPLAVIFHSGSFDYVVSPDSGDPLAGVHYQSGSRLSADWATRRVFEFLGMVPDTDRIETHTGALPAALAEQRVAMLLPSNCWGDMWHNAEGEVDNDFATDQFFRNGRASAEWAWRLATEPGFGTSNGTTFEVTFDSDAIYAVGIGEGGRAVGELLDLGYAPTNILVDSTVDDLRTYWNDATLYGEMIAGLERIFPEGEAQTTEGALGWAPELPDRSVFIFSSLDSTIPAGALDELGARIQAEPEGWYHDAGVTTHVVTGGNSTLARQAAAYLLDKDVPTDR